MRNVSSANNNCGPSGQGEKDLFHVAVLVVVAVIAVAYSNTLFAPFQFDDHLYVIDYNAGKGLGAFWPPSGTRYVTYLSFALNYRFGGLSTFGYHLVNIIIHALNSIGVYLLVAWIVRAPLLKGRVALAPSIALLSAVLFAAHPVQTEAITYISQRFASLATLFYVYSIVFYLKWRLSGASRQRWFFYLSSIALAVLAQKTKEIAFTLPFLLIFFEFTLFERGGYGGRIARLLPFALCLIIIPMTIYGHDLILWGGDKAVGDEVRGLQLKDLHSISRHDYLLTQFRVVVTYLRLIVLPVGQNLDYDYPMYRSIAEPAVFLSLVFVASVFSLGVWLFARSCQKGGGYGALAGLGVIWFFVTISIESSIIPIKDLIFEHRLYLPSAGAALFTATAIFFLKDRIAPGLKTAAFTALAVAVLATPLGVATYMRNSLWSDEAAIFEDAARKSPGKERVHYNLAWAYQRKGENDRAIAHYKETIRLKPDKDKAHYNLAVLYQTTGDNAGALEHFKEVVRLSPNNAVARYNMAAIYHDMGDDPGAIESYSEAIRINPGYGDAHFNIAWLYKEAGDFKRAEAHLHAVIALAPESADARYNLGLIYSKAGRPDLAAQELKAALEINPGYNDAALELARLTGGAR
ncbi:MAG: tetratricopeptide repeat protein [Deltaproteobacteria bacterium]|nr:tetratricopeptide repeat protein [Deltaproteobacteria bacterium]